MIIGVYKLEKNLLLILDVDKVIEVDEDREIAWHPYSRFFD